MKTTYAKKDKPFRPAALEPLWGFISVLQRSPATKLRATESAFGPMTLDFSLAGDDITIYSGTWFSQTPGFVAVWSAATQDFVLQGDLEGLFTWLKGQSSRAKRQEASKLRKLRKALGLAA